MIITHNLNLNRGNIRVIFQDENHKRLAGGVFAIEDANRIELDDVYLEEHPEIAYIVVTPADGSAKYGQDLRQPKQTTQEAFAELGAALDELGREIKTAVTNFIEKVKEKIDG